MIQQVKTKVKKFIVYIFNILNQQILKIRHKLKVVLLLDKIKQMFYSLCFNKLKEYLEYLINK